MGVVFRSGQEQQVTLITEMLEGSSLKSRGEHCRRTPVPQKGRLPFLSLPICKVGTAFQLIQRL